jgi:hypothetical protein
VDQDRQIYLRRHPEEAHDPRVVQLELLRDGMELEAHKAALDAAPELPIVL